MDVADLDGNGVLEFIVSIDAMQVHNSLALGLPADGMVTR